MMGADIKGKIYEGLLEKNAEDTKSGAGQYFTPRALIKTMVACVQPKPMKTIVNPACGTCGFFLAAYDWIVENNQLDREEKEFLKNKTFHGNEIVANTRRMCLMNMYLHNIGEIDGKSFISPNDALISDNGKSLTDLDKPPDPEILVEEIIENIEAGLQSFREIMKVIDTEVE